MKEFLASAAIMVFGLAVGFVTGWQSGWQSATNDAVKGQEATIHQNLEAARRNHDAVERENAKPWVTCVTSLPHGVTQIVTSKEPCR